MMYPGLRTIETTSNVQWLTKHIFIEREAKGSDGILELIRRKLTDNAIINMKIIADNLMFTTQCIKLKKS